ncbi:MAG: preprotein translocase subunit SecG [Gemmatimonadaceae bacterium]|nr:preprotein translocase subunit SecG [Gemmatimonadaceae bacterium]
MYTFLLAILILISLVLIAVILLQSGKGGGMAANFGGATSSADAVIGTRQAGNLLTKISWWGGGAFMFLALVLQLMTTRQRAPKSVLDNAFTAPAPAAPATAPAAGGTPKGGASALPLSPAAPAGQAPAPASPAPAKP